jgi:beta,beta-carotene 9',10'-dioxygenase
VAGVADGDAPSAPLRATHRQLAADSLELTRINSDYARREHRYVYGPGPGFSDGKGGAPFSRLLKVDVATGVATVWTRPHLHCSEAIFVADPDGSAEDDGSLLSVCHDADEGRSFLLVLDARSMTELARAYTPVVVPAGFHGAWTG